MAQEVWYVDNLGIGIANIHRLCLSIVELIIFFHFHCELQARGESNGSKFI
jgi:hypothetical protein